VSILRADSYPGFVEKRFNTGTVNLNYAVGPANGPPLVLLHGLGRRWQVFMPLIPGLAERWQIFALDFRGHGKSDRVPNGYRGLDYAHDTAEFLRECVPSKTAIFGHSLGGMVTVWIAAHHPELVLAIILGDNAIDLSGIRNSLYSDLFSGLQALAAKGGTVSEIASGIAEIRLRAPNLSAPVRIGDLPGNDQAYLEWWARCVSQADPDTYRMTLDGSSREGWNGPEFLSRITSPTLLLQADPRLGGLMSDADVDLALKVLKHASHIRFENLGHGLYMQQPEPIVQAINHFLESL